MQSRLDNHLATLIARRHEPNAIFTTGEDARSPSVTRICGFAGGGELRGDGFDHVGDGAAGADAYVGEGGGEVVGYGALTGELFGGFDGGC
jgi:hypothetical protein